MEGIGLGGGGDVRSNASPSLAFEQTAHNGSIAPHQAVRVVTTEDAECGCVIRGSGGEG